MPTKTKISRKQATKARRTGDESATNLLPIRDESAATRYAFAPLLQQFRAHTKKNEARLWIPIETNLIFRYEFAACSLQTRYIFVAILLYCGANGIHEIPLDAKFMANILNADYRTIEKSFDELLLANLLQERKEREKRKEQTDKQERDEIAPAAPVSVSDFKSLSEQSENQNHLSNGNQDNGDSTQKNFSKFSIEECRKYVELEIRDGATIHNANALAMKLFKTGQSDAFILAKLFPELAVAADAQRFGEPISFTDNPCSVCFGAKLANVDGKGYAHCRHCANERGKSTGKEPEGKQTDE